MPRLHPIALAVTLAALSAACAGPSSAPAPRRVSLRAIFAADSMADRGQIAYREKRYAESARLYSTAALTPGLPGLASVHYNAACSFALAGDREAAFDQLRRAVATVWTNTGHLRSDSDLDTLHDDPRWAALVAQSRAAEERFRAEHTDPERAALVTSDIPLFWRAYDRARAEPDSAARVEIFRREYVERASPGYLDYFMSKIGSVERFEAFVTRQRAFYDGVRGPTAGVAAMEPRIREAFRRMKELYPDAYFPDVYFGIGRLSSGGTVSARGLLIGTEMYGVAPSTPLDGLPDFARRIVSPIDELPHTVAHELVHFEQSGGGNTLLGNAIREGGADFIGELILPGGATPEYRTWGREHEAEVWRRFSSEMGGPSSGNWIGSAGSRIEAWGGWPGDLGYFVGYQISRAYYEQAADKRQAIRDLLEIRDPEAILRASGYARRFD